ncbi:fatty acyl-AMP ligase [Microbacterium sp.]|uniref:fatty acyl-AMP ligase n=1 Tax=Microbacterium sp. TaxID=51671 RepID=UPI003C755C00
MSELAGADFLRAVRQSATTAQDRGIRFYTSPTAYDEISYAELDADARARAVSLKGAGLREGDVAVLAFEPGLPFIRALMGCLYAGVVVCPAPIAATRNMDAVRDRLEAIAIDAKAKAIIAVPGALESLGVTPDQPFPPVILVEGPADADPDRWTVPAVDEDSLAILQYTSGSTGVPKGVMVSFGNLIANQLAITAVTELTEDSIGVGWLPHYHDMGLIGQLIQPIFCGAQMYLTSPSQFLRRPVLWLRLISEFRVTHAVGPDFAFGLCTRLITDEQLADLDLSSLEVVITGAEPVRMTTLEAFGERFAPTGFRMQAFVPAFGMAETTLLVTAHRDATPPQAIRASAAGVEAGRFFPAEGTERALAFVPCGPPTQDTEIAIIDPTTSERVGPGDIGEIWVTGTSVAQGYWNRPDETAAVFHATIADEPGTRWLRTGDLGVLADGELVITGRLKDLIIVRGRNIYPQDLETAAAAFLPPGCLSAAFESESSSTQIGLVAEIDAAKMDPDAVTQLLTAIARQLTDEFTLPGLSVALIRKGSLPRTTSGKVQRALTRRLIDRSELPVISARGFAEVSG